MLLIRWKNRCAFRSLENFQLYSDMGTMLFKGSNSAILNYLMFNRGKNKKTITRKKVSPQGGNEPSDLFSNWKWARYPYTCKKMFQSYYTYGLLTSHNVIFLSEPVSKTWKKVRCKNKLSNRMGVCRWPTDSVALARLPGRLHHMARVDARNRLRARAPKTGSGQLHPSRIQQRSARSNGCVSWFGSFFLPQTAVLPF